MNSDEIKKLDAFMKKRFNMKNIRVSERQQLDDSAEVFIGDESIGIIYRNDEDGELSWDFQMSILEFDLDDAGA